MKAPSYKSFKEKVGSCQAGFVGKWMPQENTLEMMAQHYHKGIKKNSVASGIQPWKSWNGMGISEGRKAWGKDIYSLLANFMIVETLTQRWAVNGSQIQQWSARTS